MEYVDSKIVLQYIKKPMYSCILLAFLMLLTVSCHSGHTVLSQNIETSENIVSKSPDDKPQNEHLELFSDSKKIGLPNKNKVELYELKNGDGNLITIKFYSLEAGNQWSLKQTFEFEKYTAFDFEPRLKDFNNDGFNDFTYVSAEAARGANEVRKLFIYDDKKDELTYIKNSEDYPNLQYNKELDCLDAWLFHSGTTTVFLKLDGDILREFASVNSGSFERTVTLIDKNGKERLLRKDKITQDDIYERYKNFDPLEPYRE